VTSLDTAVCGIVLHPAGHTLSPAIHAEAYRELGLDAVYLPFDVPPGQLAAAVAGMRALRLRQLSVSLPHKEAVLELADRVSPAARRIGAANTLTRVDDLVVADNTDWLGVTRTLEAHGPWSGRSATVLGAGGGARAVVYALAELGVEVTVVNRTPERAAQLTHELGGRVGTGDEPWDLLVNATSVGMQPESEATPFPAGQLRPESWVFDTVYRPLETRLLAEAKQRGCRKLDGLGMLVHQAVEQLHLWTGRSPTFQRLRQAAERAL